MKEFFKNCLFVDEIDGWYVPSRFTRSQLEYYGREDSTWKRSTATSSVILRFRTSATKLSLDYKIICKAREWALFDVLSDGVLYSSLSLTEDDGRVELSLPGDSEREISVYLPHLVNIQIKNITSDAPLIPVADRCLRYLALGDSITQGMVARHPFSAYPTLLSEAFDCELINAGVGGIEFNSEELDYIGYEPDLITVALGTNDWGAEDALGMKGRVCAYLDKLLSLYKCRRIYAITPTWRSDEERIRPNIITFAEHRAAIAEAIAQYHEIKLIDGYTLVPHDLSLFGDPANAPRQVHPNEEGFLHYANNLIKTIKSI